jgi:hypothetical protein
MRTTITWLVVGLAIATAGCKKKEEEENIFVPLLGRSPP